MPVEVKRKNNESLESLLRRFTKRIQQSGVLLRAKKGKYYTPPENRSQRRERAIRRTKILEMKEQLKKIGKLDEWLLTKTHRQITKFKRSTTLPSAKAEAERTQIK